MMKVKIFFLYLFIAFFVSTTFSISGSAACTDTKEILILEDGSYYLTTIEEISTSKTTSTKNGKKTVNYYNSNDELLWSVSVIGTFSYTGSSATCTSASVSTTCPSSDWKISSKSSSKNGATASAKATAKRYIDGSVTKTITKTVTLTCSATGKLS